MNSHPTSESREWLTLGDASKQLGVSPATLRQWADKGKVRSFRTPGGHRRFNLSAMQSMVADHLPVYPARQVEVVIHSALGRARLEIASGRLDGESWHRNLSPASIEQHRQLGQRLMSLLLKSLHEEKSDSTLIHQARDLGKEYARISVEHETPLTDTLRAFLFFRDYVIEGLIGLSESGNKMGLDVVDIYRKLNRLVNEMLLAMIVYHAKDKKRK